MLDKLTALESALDAQGGILENKNAALEKARGQIEKLRDENLDLQSRISRMEEQASATAQAEQVESLWDAEARLDTQDSQEIERGGSDEEPLRLAVADLESRLATSEATVRALSELSEEKEREAVALQAKVAALETAPEIESDTTRPDISLEAMKAFWQPADLERELADSQLQLAERDRTLSELREQIQNLNAEIADGVARYTEMESRLTGQLDAALATRLDDELDLKEKVAELQRKLDEAQNTLRENDEQLQDRIERKLDGMQSELSHFENLLRDATLNRREISERFLQKVEALVEKQESELAVVRNAGNDPEFAKIKERADWLERELFEKQRLIEGLSEAGEREHEEERRLHSTVDELRQTLSRKEEQVDALNKQVQSLSTKVNPELVGDDNLQLIRGVGPYVRKVLKEHFSIVSFRQIAMLSAEDVGKISAKLFFGGKIEREDWVGQAIALHFKKYSEILENPNPPYPLKWAA